MKIKIQSLYRLKAVQVSPGAMPDAEGMKDLAVWTEVFNKKKQTYIGKNAEGFTFWWTRGQRALLCVKAKAVVAVIEFSQRDTNVRADGVLRLRQVNMMFTHPDYRGKGLMLGMHQYVITQFNLLSDNLYSPEGLKIWKTLKKMGHKVEVVNDRTKGRSWTDPYTLLLIRKNQ